MVFARINVVLMLFMLLPVMHAASVQIHGRLLQTTDASIDVQTKSNHIGKIARNYAYAAARQTKMSKMMCCA